MIVSPVLLLFSHEKKVGLLSISTYMYLVKINFLVFSEHSSATPVLRLKGACNQGEKVLNRFMSVRG